MGKLHQLDVTFDNPQGVFQAGESVHGKVIVDFVDPVKIRSIYVECQGKSKVHWDKWMLRDNSRTYYECYRAEETYLRSEVCVFGEAPGGNALLHPPGKTEYPFEFTLPADLPTSFEGAHGYIRYLCKVTIERPWKFDQTTKKAFSVIRELDLNKERAVREPALFERQTPVRCCCCVSGSITATFKLDQRGYVPGQNILINAEVHNASNTHITRCKVILCQHVSFYGSHPGVSSTAILYTNKLKRHNTSRIVKCIVKGEVAAGETQVWIQQPMTVPSLPPSKLDGCKIIEVFYTVTFSVEPNWGSKLQMSTEVIIGTVPLRQLIVCPPSYSSALLDRRPSTPPPPFEAGYDGAMLGFYLEDIPPPSYEESVFGRSQFEDEEETDSIEYTPVYAVYNCAHLSLLTSAPDLVGSHHSHINRLCTSEGKESSHPLIALDRRASDSESYLRDATVTTQPTSSNLLSVPVQHNRWGGDSDTSSSMTDCNGFLTVPSPLDYRAKSHSPRLQTSRPHNTNTSSSRSHSPSPLSQSPSPNAMSSSPSPNLAPQHQSSHATSRSSSPCAKAASPLSPQSITSSQSESWTQRRPRLTLQMSNDSDISVGSQLSLISNETYTDWSPTGDTPPEVTPDNTPSPATSANSHRSIFRFDCRSVGRAIFGDQDLAGVHRACSLDGKRLRGSRQHSSGSRHKSARRVRSTGSSTSSSCVAQPVCVPLIQVTDCDADEGGECNDTS